MKVKKTVSGGGPVRPPPHNLPPGIFPFAVLGLWGKLTMPNAGTMAYRRDLPSSSEQQAGVALKVNFKSFPKGQLNGFH